MTRKVLNPPKDRWRPVLHGNTFCSPACGRGCTVREFKSQQKLANALLRECLDIAPYLQWYCELTENLGWHSAVYCNEEQVRIRKVDNFYMVDIHMRWRGRDTKLTRAFRSALNNAFKELEELGSIYVHLKNITMNRVYEENK